MGAGFFGGRADKDGVYAPFRDRPAVAGDSTTGGTKTGLINSGVLGRNVVALGFTSLLTDVSSEMIVAILPLYLTISLGLSTVAFGFFEGAYQLVGAFFRLAGGAAADRTQNHKRIAASGYALSAATRIGLIAGTFVAVPVIPVLLLERVGKGIRAAPRDALISLSTAPNKLGMAFGVHRTMDTIGAVLGPFVAFLILYLSADDYQSIFVISLAIAMIGVLVIVTFAEARPVLAARARSASRWSSVREALTEPVIRRVAIVAWALGLVTVSDGFVYLLIQQNTSLRLDLFPLLFAGTAIAYLILAIPMGWIADRFGRRRVFIAGHGATLTLYLFLAIGTGRGAQLLSAQWVLPCLALLGIYYAATDGVLAAAVSGVSDPKMRSSAIAVVTVAAALGGLLSAIGFGFAWSTFGSRWALLLIVALLAVVAPAAWLSLDDDEVDHEEVDHEEVTA